jgi:hypothetical protein
MESEQHIRKIRSDASLSADEIASRTASQKHSASSRVSALTEKINAELAELDFSFEESTRLLVTAYEKYLSEMDEASRFLPITVMVTIPSRKISLKAISIRPTDTLAELKTKVEERLKALGDPLCDLGLGTQFYLLPLFGGVGEGEGSKKSNGKEEKKEGEESGRYLLREGVAIILSCNPPPPQGISLSLSLSLSPSLWSPSFRFDN